MKLLRHCMGVIFAVTAFATACQSSPSDGPSGAAESADARGEAGTAAAQMPQRQQAQNAGSAGAAAPSTGAKSAGRSAAQGGADGANGEPGAAAAGSGNAAAAAGSGGPMAAASGGAGGAGGAGDAVDNGGIGGIGGSAAAAGSGEAGAAASAARLPAVMTTKGQGPFETKQDLATGPSGESGVFWPSELGQNGVLHPIFVWGCGGGTTPTTYAELMSTIASYGFVVIAETSTVDDKGAPLKAAIDWMLAENERMGGDFFHKLDASKVGLGGHSIGSANAFLVADDPRLTTSIHVAGGSLDMAGNINAATTGSGGKRLTHPVAYVCSETDQFGNVEKTEKDYEQTTVPAWMTVMSGVDHVGAAREGMPAIVAWLRWQLAGESERRAAFLDAGGEFTTGMYVSKNKNW